LERPQSVKLDLSKLTGQTTIVNGALTSII